MEEKKNISVNMDEKSANPGDCMKHALSLEVLSRTNAWDKVTYSETHAGAGVYLESGQKPAKPHIRNLREQIVSVLPQYSSGPENDEQSSPEPRIAGAPYYELLTEWWSLADCRRSYPGSAKQAGAFLTAQKRDFMLQLTEADEAIFQRLQKAVRDYPGKEMLCSFQDEIEWLTRPEWLYLVVDPFRCIESFDTFGFRCGINQGDIDHETFVRILSLCQDKKAAVIHLWWSKGGNDGEVSKQLAKSHRATRQLLNTWCSGSTHRTYRHFHDNHNHASALLGIGDGVRIVETIPSKDKWKASWLSKVVYELSRLGPELSADEVEEEVD